MLFGSGGGYVGRRVHTYICICIYIYIQFGRWGERGLCRDYSIEVIQKGLPFQMDHRAC